MLDIYLIRIKLGLKQAICLHVEKHESPTAKEGMFGIGRNGAKKHLSSMVNGIRFHLFCSKADELVVHFMVNSLGFSTKEAISTSAKIKTLVSSSPKLLFCDIDTTLKPKIKGLQPLNLSGSDLVTLIEKSDFLRRGLHTSIKPTLDYLRELLGTHDAVAMVLKKEPRLISQNISKVLPPNIALLQNLGFSQIDIANFFQRYPRCLLRNPVCLQRVVHQAEEIFDIPRGSRMFLHGIAALVPLHESTLERKIDIYRSFGWSHSDICTMVRKLPSCFDFIRG
ncbi:uncharacterized protein [Solanum tuberosum]|uniref:uncharacterized protein n=1 Tax=Solanum tuberosum TaxID=4113 RepID=UPI00073A081C|nr:PREDICTED: uncharacterized protein LOC102581678 [Solanum tuberosum]